MIIKKNTYEKVYYLLIIALLSYLTLFSYISELWFTTNDDIRHYLAPYSEWMDSAQAYGRIHHYVNGLYVQVTRLFDSYIYYRATHIVMMITMIFSFGWLISTTLRERYMGYIYMVLLATLWQNSGGHNMIGSYPFYVAFTVTSLLLTTIYFVKYLREEKRLYLWISLLFWIFTLKGSELWLLYLPMLLLFAYGESNKDGISKRIIASLSVAKWHIALTILSVVSYFVFKLYCGTSYSGSTIGTASFHTIFQTWMEYTFGLLPGLKFYYSLEDTGLKFMLGLISFKMFFVSSAVFVLLLFLRSKIENIHMEKRKYLLTIVIGLYTLFAPNFLISLTYKYQAWAGGERIKDYLYSSLSYFSIVFFIFLFLFVLRRWKPLYILFSFLIALIVFSTQLNNKYIGELYETHSKKFFIVDAFLQSKYIQKDILGHKILAPTLWDGMVVRDGVWNSYSKNRIGSEVNFIKKGKADEKIIYVTSELNKDAPFMIYSQKNIIKAIFTSVRRCNKNSPCYLIYIGDSTEEMSGTAIKQYSYDNNKLLSVSKLSEGKVIKDIILFEPKNIIKDSQVIALVDYNPLPLYAPATYGTEFISGVYRWEGEVGNFIWASGDVDMKLINGSGREARYRLQMELGTLKERNVIFSLNGKEVYEVHLKAGERFHKVDLSFDLPAGENRLKITTDVPAAEPGNGDHRKMSFSMGRVKYSIESR
ncbi:hypothetical protein MNB_SV-6-508 [hydrothermal vent metagenome]|uniref:Glycosyltransferase RgtA/B/C/D-like domain-containing protein n=1 Tax=hydrothermal vent metagenome TaxID=652676 RepID=A0A1W1CAQ4_9ZZZZ